MHNLILLALIGWGLSTAFWIHIWMPDPPPDALTRFIGTSIAGIVGGVLGGAILGSDPMPSHPIAGALAGSVILTGVFLAVTVKGKA